MTHGNAKPLNRYVQEFANRNNVGQLDAIEQMLDLVANLVGRRLYRDLVSENGISFLAQAGATYKFSDI